MSKKIKNNIDEKGLRKDNRIKKIIRAESQQNNNNNNNMTIIRVIFVL